MSDFSAEEAERRKQQALAAVRAATPEELREYWKQVVIYLATTQKEVSADDLRKYLLDNNQVVPKGGQWGTIFEGAGLEYTGKTAPSTWPSNKGRHVRYWRLPTK